MAKIRSIHPDTCESETLASLSATAERTFWRLLPHTDDEGRGRYQPVVLRNKLYAASTDVTADQVESDLAELADAGLIRVYRNGSKRFYHVRSWAEFQKPKYKSESSLPGPDDPDSTLDGTNPGPDLDPTESTPGPDLPYGEGEGEGVGDGVETHVSSPDTPMPENESTDEVADQFDLFWHIWPDRNGKKRNKAKALAAWRALSVEQRRRAYRAVAHYDASGEGPMDAFRFLRKDTAGSFPFDDWQEPANVRALHDWNQGGLREELPDGGYRGVM